MDGRFMAMLALEQPGIIGLEDLVADLKTRVPQLEPEIVGRPYRGEMGLASEAYIVSVSGNHFAVAYVEEPAPADRFANAVAYAVERWPDAGARLGAHAGHIVVSNLIAASSFDGAVDVAGSVTLIAGALNELAPVLGVYWAAGEVLQPPEGFAAMMDKLIAGQPPVDAWITIRAHIDDYTPDAEPTVGISTLGLNSFCGREIESAAALVNTTQACDRVLAVAADILRHGPELADNSTIRIGENDTIRINLMDRGRFSDRQPVIMLTPEEPDMGPQAPEDAAGADDGAPLFEPRKRKKPFAT